MKDGDTFKCQARKYPRLSEATLKEGVFVCPDIRKLMKGEIFEAKLKDIKRSGEKSFKEAAVRSFLATIKTPTSRTS